MCDDCTFTMCIAHVYSEYMIENNSLEIAFSADVGTCAGMGARGLYSSLFQ